MPAQADYEEFPPAPPPGASAGGRQAKGGAGPSLEDQHYTTKGVPYVDYELCGFLRGHGLTGEHALVAVVALCGARKYGDTWLLIWAEDEAAERTGSSVGSVRETKKRLLRAGLMDQYRRPTKGLAALWDVTPIMERNR